MKLYQGKIYCTPFELFLDHANLMVLMFRLKKKIRAAVKDPNRKLAYPQSPLLVIYYKQLIFLWHMHVA